MTNRKEPHRRGKVQLIDATAIKTPLRKNLGEKNCETNEADRAKIVELLMRFEETPESKIFPNNEFGYWEITVDRPLRLRIHPDADLSSLSTKDLEICREAMAKVPNGAPLDDWDAYVAEGETKIGYELSFTKYFYRPTELRSIEAITADICQIE